MAFLLIMDVGYNTDKELKEWLYDDQDQAILSELQCGFDTCCEGELSINFLGRFKEYRFYLIDAKINALTDWGEDYKKNDIDWENHTFLNLDYISAIKEIFYL